MAAATGGRSKAKAQVAPSSANSDAPGACPSRPRTRALAPSSSTWSRSACSSGSWRSGMPEPITSITPEHVEAFIADILSRSKPSTAATRYKCLPLFFAWCEDEGEIQRSPMEKMKPPIVPEEPVDVITDADLGKLLKACKGTDFEDRRDLAVICLLADTGIRRSELAGLSVDDVDLDVKYVRVLGKGRRPRVVPVRREDSASHRPLPPRARRPLASPRCPTLARRRWSTVRRPGRPTDARAPRPKAGVVNLHAHRFRHTFAHQHLAEGGNEAT